MAKKKSVSTLFTLLVFILSITAVFYTTSKERTIKTIAYINDGWVSWEDIEKITIYSDGYYGRTMEEPVIITDKNEIKQIVKSVTDANNYEHIPRNEYLEGLCTIFVDFGNSCVISMYEEENYGTIDDSMKVVAENEGYYRFPEKFRENIIDILKTNQSAK